VPQSKQTIISGKTHTTGLSMFFSLEKWMPISPVNLLWLTDAHDLQGILLQLDRIGTKNPCRDVFSLEVGTVFENKTLLLNRLTIGEEEYEDRTGRSPMLR
jgi:hypothetical protein